MGFFFNKDVTNNEKGTNDIYAIHLQTQSHHSHVSESTFFNLHNCFFQEKKVFKNNPPSSHQQIFRTNVTFDQCNFLYCVNPDTQQSIIFSFLTNKKTKEH